MNPLLDYVLSRLKVQYDICPGGVNVISFTSLRFFSERPKFQLRYRKSMWRVVIVLKTLVTVETPFFF